MRRGPVEDRWSVVDVLGIEMRQVVHAYFLRFLAFAFGAKFPLSTITIFQGLGQIFWLEIAPSWKLLVFFFLWLLGVRFFFAAVSRLAFLGTIFDVVRTLAAKTLHVRSGSSIVFTSVIALWQFRC